MMLLLKRFWLLPWLWRIAIIAGVLILILLLTSWGRDKIFNVRSWFFDREQAAATEREKKLEGERDEAIKRAQLLEAEGLANKKLAADKEAEAAALRGLIQERGGKIEAEQKRLDDELEKIKKDAGSCGAISDPGARLSCVCAKLARAGLPCAG